MMVTFVWWVTCERRQRTVVVLTAVDVLLRLSRRGGKATGLGGGRVSARR